MNSTEAKQFDKVVERLDMLSNVFVDGMFSGPLTEQAIESWVETKKLSAWVFAYANTSTQEEFDAEMAESNEIIERQKTEHYRRLNRK